jgi:hypothetical protein
MTEIEIDDLKKENIVLKMQNERLKYDMEKLQNMIKDILIIQVNGGGTDEQARDSEGVAGNNS